MRQVRPALASVVGRERSAGSEKLDLRGLNVPHLAFHGDDDHAFLFEMRRQ